MKRPSHSFLDLTALPQLGAVLLDPRPAWLWDAEGGGILWANAAGVAFFGDATVQDTLRRQFPTGSAIAGQIAGLGETLRAGEPEMTLLRFAVGRAVEPMLCLATRLSIDDDADGILIASLQPPQRIELLGGRALALAAAVAEDDVLAVVTRADGRVLAASDGFEGVDAALRTLSELAAATRTSARRMLKRRVRMGAGRRLVGTVSVTTPEGDFMLALVGPLEDVDASAVHADAVALPPPTSPDASAPSVVGAAPPQATTESPETSLPTEAASTSNGPAAQAAEEPAPAGRPANLAALLGARAAQALTAPVAAPDGSVDANNLTGRSASHGSAGKAANTNAGPPAPSVPSVTASIVEAAPPGRDDDAVVAALPEPAISEAPEPSTSATQAPPTVQRLPAPAAHPAFQFHPRPSPVRFVFHLDDGLRFSYVSPELAAVVGPRAAAVHGKSWAEIAGEFGFSGADGVTRALGRRDTWSGLTVYWPLQDSPDAVAVDLAALPAFTRGGVFEGYRGFGVCRTNDVRRSPRPAEDVIARIEKPPGEQAATAAPVGVAGHTADLRARPSSGQTSPPAELRGEPAAATPPTDIKASPVAEPAARPNADAVPPAATTLAGPSKATERSNVVRLPSSGPIRDQNLSGHEQDAFRRIAEALRAVAPRQPRPARPPPGQAPADQLAPAEPTAASGEAAVPQPGERGRAVTTAASPVETEGTDGVPMRVLDRLPLGVLVYRDTAVLFANRAFLHLLAYRDLAAFIAAGGVERLFADSGTEAPTPGRQLQLQTGSDRQVSVDALLQLVPWQNGPAMMLSITTDESGTRPRETKGEDERAALARIEELEAVLDTATDGVIVLDAEARITNLNRSAEALFGVEATDVLGTAFTGLLAPESRKSALDYLEGLARNGVASVLNDGREIIGRVPSGGLIPLFMTMGRLAERGKFCAVLRDITQWKNAEEELVAARRAAEIANQQKSEFLAKVSHEIRTPLNAVIGFSEVMLEERFGPIGSDRYREYLKDIKLSGSHLMSLINDLLDLSKIEAGKLDLAFSAVAVNDIVQESVALLQPEANRRRIIIRSSLSSSMPKVVADARSLRQIVLNLLSNAVKFTPAGGQVIVSTVLDANGEVIIRIRDTGIGMTDKELDIALKPFRQITTTNPASQGTGLGLPLTKALVEANRATFTIQSTPNQGTTAQVTFPTARVLLS